METSTKPSGPELNKGNLPVIEMYPEQQKVRVLDVVLDVCPLPKDISAQRFIPKWSSMKDAVCWDTPTALLIRDMTIRLNGGISSRSEGPTGVSKSFAVEVLAALTNRNYIRQNYSKDSDPGDTIGRFVPSDGKLAISFTELLENPKLNQESRKIIEKARTENRPLTVYESKLVAKSEGISGLEDDHQWRWQNGSLVAAMIKEYGGSIFGSDEPNLAPGNVTERENPALEKRPKLRVSEHEGEVIRPLTKEEADIVNRGGRVAGVIGLSENFWYTAAQNPWGIGGGRVEESEARRNRLQDRIVEGLTTKEYEEYLSFLVHGNQPDIVWQNRKYKGEKNIKTQYRDLENIPNVDVLIKWLAKFQTDLQSLALSGKIGAEKDIKGGSYGYSRRNMERFMDSIKASQGSLVNINELVSSGKLEHNTSWQDHVMEALYQEYLAGMYREDQEAVKKVIEASKLENFLGPSQNNAKLPDWMRDLKKKGIDVEQGKGTYTLSRANLSQAQVDLAVLEEQLDQGGYNLTENNDTLNPELIIESTINTDFINLFSEQRPEKSKPEVEEKHQEKI